MKRLPLLIFILIAFISILAYVKLHEYDCIDFRTQQDAQKVFLRNSQDVYHLDGDQDGIACENLR